MRLSSTGAIKKKKKCVEKVGGVLQSMECALAEIPIKMAQPGPHKVKTNNREFLMTAHVPK